MTPAPRLAKLILFKAHLTEKGDWRDFVIETPDGHTLVFGQLPSQRKKES